MNRRGFTAIMDAMFFIVILSFAVTAMCQMHEDTDPVNDKLYDSCDALMQLRMYPSDIGYGSDHRAMKFSDLWALSVSASDGKGTAVAEECLGRLFPQGDWYMTVTYDGKTETAGKAGMDWSQSVVRSYKVEYGGEITLVLYRC